MASIFDCSSWICIKINSAQARAGSGSSVPWARASSSGMPQTPLGAIKPNSASCPAMN